MARAGGGLIPRARETDAGAPSASELLAALPAAVLVIDAGGVVRDCNPAAETFLNLARTAILGCGIEAMTGHPLTSVEPDQPLAAYDLDVAIPGRRVLRADLSVAPLGDRPGWRVVTIQGRASHDLATRRGDRVGKTLPGAAAAAILAHEVRNPLSGIRGAAQLLETGVDSEQAALTRLIRDEVDRIAALIARMEGLGDTRPRTLGPLNIHAVLGHVRDLATAGFAVGHVIEELYDPSLPPVLGDRDALVQILVNLLKNAAEASTEGGTITLRTAYRQGFSIARSDGGGRSSLPIELAVIDDGPGAPEALAANMFDPFVTSKPSGSGLGLALVEKLVDEMGGIVEYRREGTPRRTVLRLLLPRATERPT